MFASLSAQVSINDSEKRALPTAQRNNPPDLVCYESFLVSDATSPLTVH